MLGEWNREWNGNVLMWKCWNVGMEMLNAEMLERKYFNKTQLPKRSNYKGSNYRGSTVILIQFLIDEK